MSLTGQLISAIKAKDDAKVSALLQGINEKEVNGVVDGPGWTPLHWAG